MKKILLLIFSCFLIFGCFEQNGDVKKESLKKENNEKDKGKIKLSEYKTIRNDEKIKKIIENVLNDYGFDRESFKKAIDDNDEKINIVADDFNKFQNFSSF